ncbi:MAG: alpha-amylase family glycosyl hydrolase [Myxococcota bacterium]
MLNDPLVLPKPPLGLPIGTPVWNATHLNERPVHQGLVDQLRWLATRYEGPPLATTLILAETVHDALRHLFVAYFAMADVAGLPEVEQMLDADWPQPVVGHCLEQLGLLHRGTPSTLTELVLLKLALDNPAFQPLAWLMDDQPLRAQTPSVAILDHLEQIASTWPPVPMLHIPLFDALRAPMRTHPNDLNAQLDYIITRWGTLLPDTLFQRLLVSRDIVAEETALRGLGPGPIQPPGLGGAPMGEGYTGDTEHEAFSPDRDWMSNVVLIAKSTHVWLNQLSHTYDREIQRLDQIPDAELDRLASLGFSALWLIGLWERSKASQTIKQMMGSPQALASAYAIYDYTIAADLGGDQAWRNLRDRAAVRGIRLAGDMVPNHYGLNNRWLVDHPERFLQLDQPPYPNYRFTGPDLSTDGRVCVQIEDGYWDQSDAAVVFRTINRQNGHTRYIYHGNDGTHMPWNDTAQLDYLNPETREAIIQVILEVARRFPIIRFDAAMTLARRHIRRLWYPAPGYGGAIPSRAGRGMSDVAFEQALPNEFWREVVDRIQAEAPDTLLLAEAFWMMEGYFVRTLGMHRVYNSAFMNMLKEEQNANYRSTIKDVLEFSPEVLKRFVNFMNNPDEETAVQQFGRGDKAFGVTTLMVTLPGLPLFGHGQIEGWTEKYGMEYAQARYQEPIDEAMVQRHRDAIVPLLRKRYLFSEATHFALYDVVTPRGSVDENVFAYSNRAGDERALVVYNNAYRRASGWIRGAAPINTGSSTEPHLVRRTLTEAMGLQTEQDWFILTTDIRSGEQFIRSGIELAEQGLYVELEGYQTRIFTDVQQVFDHDGTWTNLWTHLAGRPCTHLLQERHHLQWASILDPWSELVRTVVSGSPIDDAFEAWADALQLSTSERRTWLAVLHHARQRLPMAAERLGTPLSELVHDPDAAAAAASLVALLDTIDPQAPWKPKQAILQALDNGPYAPLVHALQLAQTPSTPHDLTSLFTDAQGLLGVHTHDGIAWFNKERMELLLDVLAVVNLPPSTATPTRIEERSTTAAIPSSSLGRTGATMSAPLDSRGDSFPSAATPPPPHPTNLDDGDTAAAKPTLNQWRTAHAALCDTVEAAQYRFEDLLTELRAKASSHPNAPETTEQEATTPADSGGAPGLHDATMAGGGGEPPTAEIPAVSRS